MKKKIHLNLARLGMVLVCLVICGGNSLTAAPGDSHWDRQFGLPGTTNRAYALLFGMVQRQASMVSFVTIFWLLGMLFLALVPLVLLMKRPTHGAGPLAAH